MEMRFFIPSNELAGDMDPVDSFQQQVMQKASVISVSGDAIAIFREIQCLTPRYIITKRKTFNSSNYIYFTVVDMTLKYSIHSFNFMVKLLIIKFQCQQF